MAGTRYPIGIDLGTTFSALSYVNEQGRLETVRLSNGKLCMASAIYFSSEKEIIVGDDALDYTEIDASRVVRAFKRHMGEANWIFEVDGKKYRPEELSAFVLRKLVQDAEKVLGPIKDVVISVPYMFDARKRQATKNAGRIAGLNVIDIVDEPVAGALTYAYLVQRNSTSGNKGGEFDEDEFFGGGLVAIYDLGGGTFDLTLMTYKREDGFLTFKVLATDGDARLGGEDWDNALLEHLKLKYRQVFDESPDHDKELIQSLRKQAVAAKHTLSERARAEVELRRGEESKMIEVSRGEFQTLAEPLVYRTELTLREMMSRSGKEAEHINTFLLIGGSSRMPMIGSQIQKVMGGRPHDRSLSPDTAVSQGAALFAAYRTGHKQMQGIKIRTVNPHALGLLVYSNSSKTSKNIVLIMANQETLTKVMRTFPVTPRAKEIVLIVLQGDRPDPKDCIVLGKAKVPGLTAEVLEGAKVDVTFQYTEDGLLKVEGLVRPPGKEPVAVSFDVNVEGGMSQEQVTIAEETLTGVSIL